MASKGTSPISRQTSQVDSFRVPDHSGVGDFALHCGVREDLFADRATSTVSVWWLSAGRSKPRRVYRNLSDGVVFLKSGHLRSWVPGRALAQAQLLKRRVRQELTETATERPDPPAVRLRADAERRPLPEGLRRAWRLDEDQSTDRPVAFDAGLAELPFDDKTGGVRRFASPGNLGTFRKAGEHGMIRRINQYRRWGWRLRLVANHAGFKGT